MSRIRRLLAVRKISEESTVPPSTIYDAVARGEIPAIRCGESGRSIRIDEDDWSRWVKAHKETAR